MVPPPLLPTGAHAPLWVLSISFGHLLLLNQRPGLSYYNTALNHSIWMFLWRWLEELPSSHVWKGQREVSKRSAFWSSAFDMQSHLSKRGICYKIFISIYQKKAGEFKFSFSGWNACITTCSDTSVGSEESKWVSTWRPEADYHLLNMYRNSSLCIKSIWCWCPWLFNIDIECFVCTSTSETSCSPPLKSAWFKVPQVFYIQWAIQILQFERVVHQLIVTDYEC